MNKSVQITENLPAYHSYPDTADSGSKHPGLILIHEIWGLQPHIKEAADRFAAQGYSVLAPDLFADVKFETIVDQNILGEMQDPEKRDEAQKKMRAYTAPVYAPEFGDTAIKKLQKCFEYLQNDPRVTGQKIGVLGFCFGGTYSFVSAYSIPETACAVPFYGRAPELSNVKDIHCPVLAFYGEKDTALMETLPALQEEMKKQEKDFEAVVYPNCGHAFFNDSNPRMYNKDAADDAWKKSLVFLEKNLKS